MKRAWTEAESAEMLRRYPNEATRKIAKDLGRSERSVYSHALSHGVYKSRAYQRDRKAADAERLKKYGAPHRFQSGNKPWNKGTHFKAGGRSAETRFKTGEMSGAAQANYVPVGSVRVNYGNLERKLTDDPDIYPAARWRPVHRSVWEAEHGPVPAGHIVVFKPGMHTTVEAEITLDKLECISRAENMRRNTIHRYPKELISVIRQVNSLDKIIREQDA